MIDGALFVGLLTARIPVRSGSVALRGSAGTRAPDPVALTLDEKRLLDEDDVVLKKRASVTSRVFENSC